MGHDITIKWHNLKHRSIYISYNLSDMYYTALSNCWYWYVSNFWAELDNKIWKEVLPMLTAMHSELVKHPRKYRKYGPTNWRWSYDQLVDTLRELIGEIHKAPNKMVQNCY